MTYRRLLSGFTFVVIAVLGVARAQPSAQAGGSMMKAALSDEDYVKTMKQIAPAFQSLQKNNTAMNYADAATDAQKLEASFKEVQAYWEAKKIEDAIGFAKKAVAAAQDASREAAAMSASGLADAQKALGGTCQGCHTAHREKLADGSYRIK